MSLQQTRNAMKNGLTAQIHQYLTSAPGSLFAQQAVEMLDHWPGDTNLLWRVSTDNRQAVVKLFLDAGQARSRRQYDGHLLFAPLGLAPQPLWVDRYPHGLSRQLLVYEWCDGESIALDDPGALWAWAEAIGTLHAAPPDDVRRFSPHPLNLDYFWRIEQASITRINEWLAGSGLGLATRFCRLSAMADRLVQNSLPLWALSMPTPVHGDLSHSHTLMALGRIQLLDWEMFGLGDPALDVARLLQREAQWLSEDHARAWLDRYMQIVDDPTVAERIGIYRRLLEAHNVVYLLVGLQQHSTSANGEELAAALPFIQDALVAALERAASSFALEGRNDSQEAAVDFITWFTAQEPAPR
jgi:hypothetical protein